MFGVFRQMEKLQQFVREHQWTVTLIVLGVLLSVLLFSIGLIKTLILFAIVAIACYFGSQLDKKGSEGVKRFIQEHFNTRNGDR